MTVPIKKIKPNPRNPRTISRDKYAKLKTSLQTFPDMLNKRPLIVVSDHDGTYMVLGGNMRLKAAKELGLTELPVILADDWTPEQCAEFLVKDNVSYGDWDHEQLANEWDEIQLEAWGLDLPVNTEENGPQIEADQDKQTNTITLEYTADDYARVKSQLAKIASTPEQAVWVLLGNE
jgi:hypothetical protein